MRLIWTREVANPTLPLSPAWALCLTPIELCQCEGCWRWGAMFLMTRSGHQRGSGCQAEVTQAWSSSRMARKGDEKGFLNTGPMSTYLCLFCIINAWQWVFLGCSLYVCTGVNVEHGGSLLEAMGVSSVDTSRGGLQFPIRMVNTVFLGIYSNMPPKLRRINIGLAYYPFSILYKYDLMSTLKSFKIK